MLHYVLSLAVCVWHTPSPHWATNAHWTLCSWIYLMTLCQPRRKCALYVKKLASNRVEVTWILYSANKLWRCSWYYPITGLERPSKFLEFRLPRIYRHSAHESGKFVSLTHQPPLHPPGDILCIYLFIYVRDSGLSQWKIPAHMGIETAMPQRNAPSLTPVYMVRRHKR